MPQNTITAFLPSKYWDFNIAIHKDDKKRDHIVLFKWDFDISKKNENILVRIHSECITWDLFWSFRCDCWDQLRQSLELIEKEWRWVLIYLRQEGRGIWIEKKLEAYNLQDEWLDTIEANIELWFDADLRTYEIAWKILKSFWISSVRLITNNPNKKNDLEKCRIKINEVISIKSSINKYNEKYLKTKKQKCWHWID